MTVVVVDASVWIIVLIATDVNHQISRTWLQQWVDDGKTNVLPEVAGAISRRTGIPALGDSAAASILGDPSIALVLLDRPLVSLAAQHAATFPLRGADAVYTALAERQGIPLVTWDSEQLTRAAGRIQVQQPSI
jgi:predicted nucleic acid-binding protein